MEDLLQYIPLILIALFSLLRVFRKKTRQQPEPDEQEVTLPLWDNFPATEDASDEPLPEFLEIEKPSVAQEPVVQLPAVEDSQPAHELTPPRPTWRKMAKLVRFTGLFPMGRFTVQCCLTAGAGPNAPSVR